MKLISRKQVRERRKARSIAVGTDIRPRISVFRSNRFIYAQLIDDFKGVTLASCSSLDPEVAKKIDKIKGKIDVASEVGKILATRALAKNIKTAVFDRSGYQYHGRVKSLAEGARAGGLVF